MHGLNMCSMDKKIFTGHIVSGKPVTTEDGIRAGIIKGPLLDKKKVLTTPLLDKEEDNNNSDDEKND